MFWSLESEKLSGAVSGKSGWMCLKTGWTSSKCPKKITGGIWIQGGSALLNTVVSAWVSNDY